MLTECTIIVSEVSEARKPGSTNALVAVYAVVARATVSTGRTGAVVDDFTKTKTIVISTCSYI